jgi:hypothetical protein
MSSPTPNPFTLTENDVTFFIIALSLLLFFVGVMMLNQMSLLIDIRRLRHEVGVATAYIKKSFIIPAPPNYQDTWTA